MDYTGRWDIGLHEAFWHDPSGNDANVTRFGQLGHKEVPHHITDAGPREDQVS